MSLSPNVVILTRQELDEISQKAFLRGVDRGRFEERTSMNEHVALNCKNWKDGHCETCGAQWRNHEVDATFHCPQWTPHGAKG
jgi:hypothetical protein